MNEAQPSSQPESTGQEFPNGKTVRGKVYGVINQYDEKIVVMSEETWVDFGTTLESLRRVAASQDKRIKELIAQVASEQAKVADSLDRLEAHREARRREQRAELEPGSLVLPGSASFNNRKGS